MGNDNMVQNQKVFIRLEKVLEFQRLLLGARAEAIAHSKINSEEANIASREAWQNVGAMQRVIDMLELPITL
jgi:hypothetical protein